MVSKKGSGNCFVVYEGIKKISPLPVIESRENMNSNSLRVESLPLVMAFRVPVGRGEGGRRNGRPVANAELIEELRIMQEQMEAMRETGRRDPEAGDVSGTKR